MRIWINTENDAFSDAPEFEVSRILRELADKLEAEGLVPTRASIAS